MVVSSVNEVQKRTDSPPRKLSGLVSRFVKNSKRFMREARIPNKKDFGPILRGHLLGVIALGLFAYFIKVVHIPINNMIAGSDTK